MMSAGDRAPKFPFNRTDYVHVGEEIILREGSNLKGSRGLMPISAHLIQSYVNAIDESKRKYAAEHNIDSNPEYDENKAEENIEAKTDENTEETTEKNDEENTEEITEMVHEVSETNEIPEVESKQEESIENKPNPESEKVTEASIETSMNLTDSTSPEELTEEEITVPSIRSSLIDVPILL